MQSIPTLSSLLPESDEACLPQDSQTPVRHQHVDVGHEGTTNSESLRAFHVALPPHPPVELCGNLSVHLSVNTG